MTPPEALAQAERLNWLEPEAAPRVRARLDLSVLQSKGYRLDPTYIPNELQYRPERHSQK